MKNKRTAIVFLVCIILFFNNTLIKTGSTSYAAAKLDLKLTLESNGSVNVSWSEVKGADYYSLLFVSTSPLKCIATEKKLTTTKYTSKENLNANAKYSVVIVAYSYEKGSLTSELKKILIPHDFYKKDVSESVN